MFIVSLTYKKDLLEVDKFIEAHVKFLKEKYAKNIFLASGRKIPRTGGVILARAKSKEELLSELKGDPFYINEVADYDIIEFVPSMTCKELEFIKE
jgi:uncharacterized protein YciI